LFGIDFTPERIRAAVRSIAPQTREAIAERVAGSVPKSRQVVLQADTQRSTMEAILFLLIERIIDGIDDIANAAAASSQNAGS
jgi:hypothetical protein